MGGPDALEQRRVPSFTRAWLALLPSAISAGRDVEQPTHRRDPVVGPVRAHEPERLVGVDFFGIVETSDPNGQVSTKVGEAQSP